MTKIALARTVLCLFIFVESAVAQGSWAQKNNFGGVPRSSPLAFSIGSNAYVGTGYDGSDLNNFWQYNEQTDTWTQKANLSVTGRRAAIGFSIGNKGYAGMGNDYLTMRSDFWEYNPQLNTWVQKASYPGAGKSYAVAFTIGNLGYVGTGSSSTQIGNETKEFWQYNPANDTWTRKADFGGDVRDRAVGFSLASKGYIGTGYHFTGDGVIAYGDFWQYDPVLDIWTEKASMPGTGRFEAVGFASETKGYIGMGYSNKIDFWQYDPLADFWLQVADFPGNGRLFSKGLSINNKGYVGFGYSVNIGGPTTFYDDFWQFTEPGLHTINVGRENSIGIYPNPVVNTLNISSTIGTILQAAVYDLDGKQQLKTNDTSFDVSSLSAGIYYLKILTVDGSVTKKFVKI